MLAGQKIGPFSVETELGSGAMGSVFRAIYTKTGKRVAIKIIAPGLSGSDKAMERFEREAAILKQLNHPHIVRLYATGKFQGTPFYAMEYVEGESLDHVMARRGRITWEEVVTMGQQLCSALQHAHEQGIIHRDLKPSNLMVLADGTLKLTDFGIAKDLDVVQLTSANCTVGTAAYMSPEQCRGERNLTPKSDLYSLGVVFYELITGRKPFICETPMDMFLMHVQGTFERPSRLVLDMPSWLDTLICQLLEKKPEHRPFDAATVSRSLSQIQEKVEAQQSAGVDAVRTRIKDRARTDLELDEHDKAAARTILGKKRKPKKKGRGVPFYQRLWFKGAVLSVLLIAVGYLIFAVFLRTPTPDELYQRARQMMKSREDWDEARKGPIADYLKHYPDRDDKHARQIHAWADQIDLATVESRLLLWIRTGRNENMTDPEKKARLAIKQEEAGNLNEAAKLWEGLLENLKATDQQLHSWGLLARSRLDTSAAVRTRRQQLEAMTHKPDELTKLTDPLWKSSARAVRYQQFGDGWTARAQWGKLRDNIRKHYDPQMPPTDEKSPDLRIWFLLASLEIQQLEAKGVKTSDDWKKQARLIKTKLAEAAQDSEAARGIYQDVIDLYDGIDDLSGLVKEARGRLKKL